MEKNKVGEFHFVTESYLMDFRGRITIPMIGTYLLHAASCHAADRGFGYNDMTERHTAWVLSRLAIEMKEYPTASIRLIYTLGSMRSDAFSPAVVLSWRMRMGNLWIRPFYLGGYRCGNTPADLVGYRQVERLCHGSPLPDRKAGKDCGCGE